MRLLVLLAALVPSLAMAQGVKFPGVSKAVVLSAPFSAVGCFATPVKTGTATISVSRASSKVCPIAAGEQTCTANQLCVTEQGALLEPTRVQLYPTPAAPAGGTVTFAATGLHQFWVVGTGSQQLSASGTLTATGLPCTATAAAPCEFTVTALGATPTGTLAAVTGSLTRAQVEAGAYPTSFISALGTRNGDLLTSSTYGVTGLVSDFCIQADVKPLGEWNEIGSIFRIGTANPNASIGIQSNALTMTIANPAGQSSSAQMVLDGLTPSAGAHTIKACQTAAGRPGVFVDDHYPTQGLSIHAGGAAMGAMPNWLYFGSNTTATTTVGAYLKNFKVLKKSPLAIPSPARVLWVADSIYYNTALQSDAGYYASAGALNPLTHDVAAYSGNISGSGLVELADTTYAYETGAWSAKTRGVPFSNYLALVFEFGANDSGGATDTLRRTYDKILDQARKIGFTRVCAGTPPPHSTDMVNWDASPYEFGPGGAGGHYAAVQALWTKWGAYAIDAVAKFKALTSAGTNTVAQLSADGVHPALPTGYARIGEQVGGCLLNGFAPASATPEIPGQVVNELFGQPISGAWAITSVTPGMSTAGQLNRIAGYAGEQVLQSSTSGAVVRFRSYDARAIWLRYYVDTTAGGSFTWYIDRGTGGELFGSISTNFYTMHPISTLLADNLSAGTHQVEIQTTSASPVRILGVTYVGVP